MGWDDELDALIANLGGFLVGALETAEACLRFATIASETETDYIFNSALHRALDVKKDIDTAVPLSGRATLPPDALDKIATALDETSDPPLAAWYTADRIGRLVSRDFGSHMLDAEGRTEFLLEDLAVYPVPPDACHAIYGAQKFSERAGIDRHPFDPYVATGLALWRNGRHGQFRVRIDTEAGEAFNAALEEGGGLRVALIQPNAEFSDLDVGKWTDPTLPDSRFFGIRPKNPESQFEVITEALKVAVSHDVGIVLLPELVTTEEKAAAFGATLRDCGPNLQVVVGGSYHHIDDGGKQRNSTRVHFVERIGGRRPADRIYSKSGPFYMDITTKSEKDGVNTQTAITETSGQPDLKFREDVEPSLEVRLYVGENITAAVVICSDLFDRSLRHLLFSLCPSLVLVCNMSYKTDGFVGIAHEFVNESQSTSVMVNNPGRWNDSEPDHTIVGMPLGHVDDRVIREQFQPGEHVMVFDSRAGATGRPFLGMPR